MEQELAVAIDDLEQSLRQALGPSLDVRIRRFVTNLGGERRGLLAFIDGLADGNRVEAAAAAVTRYTHPPFAPPLSGQNPLQMLREAVLPQNDVRLSSCLTDSIGAVLAGDTLLALDGAGQVLLISTSWNPGRGVEEPGNEQEVQGAREAFLEYLLGNLVLIRRRVADPRLRLQSIHLGRRSRTLVAIAYLDGVASSDLVAEVRRRIERIQIDAIQGANTVAEMIRDAPSTPFPTQLVTERPDRVAAAIFEGRVAILVDGTPFVVVVPVTFFHLLQAPGDYYQHYLIATAYRALRLLAFITAFTIPAAFVMLVSFHHEMIPTPLAPSIAGGREGTPFPTAIEVLAMLTMFEIMHEAGLRLPQAVGQTVSIVGALVMGEAAVQAGLVAPGTIIVVAASGIAGFALPVYQVSLAVRLLRIVLILLSATLGVFGFILGTSVFALHLASLRSFGTPYLAPIAPFRLSDQEDSLVRAPWWRLRRRPDAGGGGSRRQPAGQQPSPPQRGQP